MNHRVTAVLAAVALAGGTLLMSGGCGTQYGGRPSSIPRDVDSGDTTGTGGSGSGTGGGSQTSGSGGGGGGTGGRSTGAGAGSGSGTGTR